MTKKELELQEREAQIKLSETLNSEVANEMAEIRRIDKAIADLTAELKEKKAFIESRIADMDIATFFNSEYVVSFRSACDVRTINCDNFEKKDPSLFNSVFSVYGKTTAKASGYTWKKTCTEEQTA